MNCAECEENEGEPVWVEYADGNTERIPLCEDCQAEYEDGGLIREVDPTESD